MLNKHDESVLGGFLKNVCWRLNLTWNREGDSSNLDCSTELVLNSDEQKRLSEKEMENLKP